MNQPRKDKGTPAGGEFDKKTFEASSDDLTGAFDLEDIESIDPEQIAVADLDGEFYMPASRQYGNPGCECGVHDATVRVGDRYLCAGSDAGEALLDRRLDHLRTQQENGISDSDGGIAGEIDTIEKSLAGNPPAYKGDDGPEDFFGDFPDDLATDTPSVDYAEGDLDEPGFYKITAGGDMPPDGPFSTLEDLVDTTGLDDYPSDGYIVHSDDGVIGSVPSLNPDIFYHPPGDEGRYSNDEVMDTSVVPEPDPTFTPVPMTKGSNGEWSVRSAMHDDPVESDDGRSTRTTFHMGGMPARRVENKAVALRMARSNQTEATAAKMEQLAIKEAKVTALTVDSMGNIDIKEGRLILDQSGKIALMNKGASSKGVYVSATSTDRARQIVDIDSAYGRADVLEANFNEVRSKMPRIGKVTFDGIPEDDGTGEGRDNIAAAYMLDHRGLGPSGDGATAGAVFFATDRDSEYGIVNGYTVFPGDSMLTSEHGSMYEKDLEAMGGRVEGFRPGSMTFSDAMTLGDRAGRGYSGEGDNDIESVWDSVTKASR